MTEEWDSLGYGWEPRLCESSAGIGYILGVIERLRADLDKYLCFSKRGEEEAERVFGRTRGTDGQTLLFYNVLTDERKQSSVRANAQESTKVPNPEECRRWILELLSRKETALRARLEIVKAQEETQLRAEAAKAVLPGEKSMERLQRYEASIERQLYKAMNQLERLQGKRRGESVPPTINVEMSDGG